MHLQHNEQTKPAPPSLGARVSAGFRSLLFTLCLVIPGGIVAIVCGYFSLLDYAQLQADYAHYRQVAASGAGLQATFVAHAAQDIHHTNLFAEGVWAMLGLAVFGIGLIGMSLNGSRR